MMTTRAAPTIGPSSVPAPPEITISSASAEAVERHRLRADELVVVDEQDAGDAAQQAGEQAGPEADHPDVVAERVHAPRLVARAAQAAPNGERTNVAARRDREQKDDQRRVVEAAAPRRARGRTAPAGSPR